MSFKASKNTQKPCGNVCTFKVPFLYNYYGILDAETATTVAAPFDPLATVPLPGVLGDTNFSTDGCDDLILRVAYYDDGDNRACDNCPAPIGNQTVVEAFIYMPKGYEVELPGYIVDYDFVAVASANWTGDSAADYALAGTVDADGNTIGITAGDTKFYISSARKINPCCLLPDVTVPDSGVVVPGDVAYVESRTPVAGGVPAVYPSAKRKGGDVKVGEETK